MFIGELMCHEYMKRALNEPVRINCGPDVLNVRQRCYLIRQRHRARGGTRFDGLKFRIINGSELVIDNLGQKFDITAEDIVKGVIERRQRDRKNDAR